MQGSTVVCVLLCTCVVTVLYSCDSDEPEGCYFWSDTCSWQTTSGWYVNGYDVDYYPYYNYYLSLRTQHGNNETVESRLACSTNNEVHCLKFRYSFEVNNTLHLSIIVNTTQGQQEVWRMSTSRGWDKWDYATVPVMTTTNFTVIFIAWGSESHRVAIDTIEYYMFYQSTCDIKPSSAVPPRPPVTTTPAIETTSLTTEPATSSPSPSTTPSITLITTMTPEPSTTLEPTTTTSDVSTTSTPTPPTSGPQQHSSQSSSDVGVVVGVVVAVVVVVMLVGLVVGVVFWRRQRHLVTTCLSRKQAKEDDFSTRASDNPAYSLHENDPHRVIRGDVIPESASRDVQHGRRHELPVAPPPVIPSAPHRDDVTSSSVEYTPVRKPQKACHTALQHERLADNPYEVTDSGHAANMEASVSPSTAMASRDGPQNLYYNVAISTGPGIQLQSTDTAPHPHTSSLSGAADIAGRSGPSDGVYQVVEDPPPSEVPPDISPISDGVYKNLKDLPASGMTPVICDGDPAGQYQRLDFEGKALADNDTDDVAMSTYSHLRQGTESDYNVLDRQPRTHVVDGDYSHI